MTIRKIQQEQDEWALKNFGQQPLHRSMYGVFEELGELCHNLLKIEQNIRTDEKNEEEIVDSIGDAVIFLMGVCNKLDIDLQTAVQVTWNKVKQRDWKKFPNNGVDK